MNLTLARLRCAVSTVLLFTLTAPLPALAQTLRPLVTEDPTTLADHELEIQVGLEWIKNYTSASSLLSGPLTRLPIVGVNYGVGDRVELQLRAPLRQRYEPDGESPRSASGDATIATKFRLFGGGVVPALALRAIVKLPNVNEASGIGTDETDVTLEALGGVDIGGLRLVASLGIAILGDPAQAASQNDKLVYGVGALIPLGLFELGFDLHGLRLGDSGAADEWSGLAGLATRVGPLRLDAAAGVFSRAAKRSLQLSVGATLPVKL